MGFLPQQSNGQINHGLCLRAWDKHSWPYFQLKGSPEAATHQILQGDRLVKMLSPEAFEIPSGAFQLHPAAGMEQQALKP
jgi:hypothetical protein